MHMQILHRILQALKKRGKHGLVVNTSPAPSWTASISISN